ncbi:MAG: hypothetical protein AAB402_03735 [Patescibacteria group bacterium]
MITTRAISAAVPEERPPTYLELVLRRAIDLGLAPSTAAVTFDQKIMELAELVADSATSKTSPTDEQIRGAIVIVMTRLAYALRSRAGSDLDQAAHVLATQPYDELLATGREIEQNFKLMVEGLKSAAFKKLRRLSVEYRADTSLLEYTDEFGIEWVGHYASSKRGRQDFTEATLRLMKMRHMIEIGRVLEEAHPSFFNQHYRGRYDQCLGNLAVNLALHRELTTRVTVSEIRHFLMRFTTETVDATSLDQIGQMLGDHLRWKGIKIDTYEWFIGWIWPGLTSYWRMMATFPVTYAICVASETFIPDRPSKPETLTFERVTSTGVKDLAEVFIRISVKDQCEVVHDLDGQVVYVLLLRLNEMNGEEAVAEFLEKARREDVAKALAFMPSFSVEDLVHPRPELPDWLKLAIEHLQEKPPRRLVLERMITKLRQRTP